MDKGESRGRVMDNFTDDMFEDTTWIEWVTTG